MWSKTVADLWHRVRAAWPGANSIALRMTLFYATSSFALVVVATTSLYWALNINLEREDAQSLQNDLQNLRLVMSAAPPIAASAASTEQDLAFPSRQEIYVRLLDPRGDTLYETPGMSAQLPVDRFPVLKGSAMRQSKRQEISTPSGAPFQIVSAYLVEDAQSADLRVLQLAVGRADEERFLRHYRDLSIIVLTLSVFICAAIGYIIARAGLRPLERISATARRIRSTTLHERIEIAGLPGELTVLATTFNEMLDRLEGVFERMSRFSADVAHELRVPITNLRGEVEVALGKPRSAEEYQDVLGSCLEEFLRLSRIIQSLLFLAKADQDTEFLSREDVDLRQALGTIIEFYETSAAEAGVVLRMEAGRDIHASLDRTLVQQAVGNLITNAIAHTPTGGEVVVRLSGDDTQLAIEVSDNGCGIPAKHLPHLFNRFYRVTQSRSGSAHNVGLGLTMVRSIVQLHGGTVDIESIEGRGTRATIRLPVIASPVVTV